VCFETYEGIFYDILKKINKQHFSWPIVAIHSVILICKGDYIYCSYSQIDHPTANANIATVLGSIPASSDTGTWEESDEHILHYSIVKYCIMCYMDIFLVQIPLTTFQMCPLTMSTV
jgi:hypothetical protein